MVTAIERDNTTARAPLSMGQRRELHKFLQALRRERDRRELAMVGAARRLAERIEADHEAWEADGEPEYEEVS